MIISEIPSSKDAKESDITTSKVDDDSFTFEFVGEKIEGKKEHAEFLMKWGLKDNLRAYTFRHNFKFNDLHPETFFLDLFNNPDVKNTLDFVGWPSGKYTKVSYTKLRVNAINLEMFNRVENDEIVVAENKLIKGQFEEEIRGIKVADRLRDCLLNEDGENYSLFGNDERKEFLFKIFSHLVFGGAMCQYEDTITPYLEQTKLFYKTLVNARKDPKTNQIFIESHVYEIHKLDDKTLFNKADHPQNFLYAIISPSTRQVTLFGHKWVPYW